MNNKIKKNKKNAYREKEKEGTHAWEKRSSLI